MTAFAVEVPVLAERSGYKIVNGMRIALLQTFGLYGRMPCDIQVWLYALERTGGQYGLQTMCEAGGMANATIIERF